MVNIEYNIDNIFHGELGGEEGNFWYVVFKRFATPGLNVNAVLKVFVYRTVNTIQL